ncbi:MAG: DUF11 domain-containing protein [Anaerolineae bacterium]|nr:DUF11 domain-containing protein [Anaerolineae bacterium]
MQIIHKHRSVILFLVASVALCMVWLFLTTTTSSVQGASNVFDPQAPQAAFEINQLGPNSAFANDVVVYTILFTNTGTAPLSNIIITDTQATKMIQDINKLWKYGVLLNDVEYTSQPANIVASHIYTVSQTNKRGELTLFLNPIAAGTSGRIMISARVPITLQPALKTYEYIPGTTDRTDIGPSTVENAVVATVQGDQHIAPLATTQIVAPLLALSESSVAEVAPVNQCRIGRLITYTLVVKNTPNSGSGSRGDTYPASHLVISHELPIEIASSILDTDATVPGVNIVQNGAEIVWTYPNSYILPPGDSATMTILARVPHTIDYEEVRDLITKWDKVLAHADFMPFRDATLQKDYKVRILGPFEKTVVSQAPKVAVAYPNRVITYTITFYSPFYDQTVYNMTMYDTLPQDAAFPDAFTFMEMAEGSTLGEPDVISKTLIWKNVVIPPNSIISASFKMRVSSQLFYGRKCNDLTYFNAVSGTLMGMTFNGHNGNKYAPLGVTRQIDPKKNGVPSTQIAGSDITYTISLRNRGETPIYPPLVITDELPLELVFKEMVGTFPTTPTLVSETGISKIYRWDNVLMQPIAPGETFEFSYLALANEVNLSGVTNIIYGYNADTSICQTTEKVIIKPGVHYNKVVEPYIVVQGESMTYTVQISNLSPNTPFTLTEFRDLLESSPLKGTRDAIDGDDEYVHVLSPTYRIEPLGEPWEHNFVADLVGYGVGNAWCDMLENPAKGVIYQRGTDILEKIDPGGWYSGLPGAKTAPFCAVPHFSLYQKVYPNPISVGQVFTVELRLRDNRVNPPSALTGVTLTWQVPLTESISGVPLASFKILDSDLTPDEIGDGSYTWRNLTVPAGGSLSIVLHVQAPIYKKPGWSKTYNKGFTAQVAPLADPSICIPTAVRFIVDEDLSQDCEGKLTGLVMNQGIELDKYPDQEEVPPYSLLTYRIIVKNLTGAPVQNVRITDTLPSLGSLYWIYMNMEQGPEPISTDPLVWIIPEVPAKDRVELYVAVRTHQFLGFEYNQLAGDAPINLSLNTKYTDHVEVKVISGIGFFKAANPDRIYAGDPTTYTIMLNNGSEDRLKSIVVTDTLPDGFTFTHVIAPADLTPVITGQQLVWTIPGEMKTGQSTQIIYGVATDEDLFSGRYYSLLEASARNAATNEWVQVPSTDEAAPVNIQGVPQVLADKSASPATLPANQPVLYTVTLYNETTLPYPIVLTDTLPVSFTFVAPINGTPAPQVIPGEREKLVWSGLGSIQPGQTIKLYFQAQPDYFTVSNVYCNDVQVQMGEFLLPKRTPDAGCVRVVQIPRVDIEITKSDGKTRVEPGELLDYTITYTNAADSEASVMGVIITDTFAHAEYMDAIFYGPEWQVVDNQYVYLGAAMLEPGESGSVTISARLTATIPAHVENIENRVEISYYSTEQTVESKKQNNQASDWDFFKGPDLVISDLTITPNSLTPGQPMNVAVVVTNLGDPITHRWDGTQDNPPELFAVEVYLRRRPSVPPQDVFDHDEGWERGAAYLKWIDGRLDTNESVTANFPLYVPSGGGSYDVYAQVDVSQGTQTLYWGRPWGLILELDENNNITAAYPLNTVGTIYLPLVLRQH